MNTAWEAEQIPYTPETRPDPRVVDFTRAALERNRKRQNERDVQEKQPADDHSGEMPCLMPRRRMARRCRCGAGIRDHAQRDEIGGQSEHQDEPWYKNQQKQRRRSADDREWPPEIPETADSDCTEAAGEKAHHRELPQ